MTEQGPDGAAPDGWAPPDLGSSPSEPPPPAPWEEPPAGELALPAKGPRTWLWVAGAVVLAVLVAGAVWLLVDDDEGDRSADGTFADPQDEYTIDKGPGWRRLPDVFTGAEAFSVAGRVDGFVPNVNVVGTRDGFGVDEAEYVERSADTIERQVQESEVVDLGTVDGTDGRTLGFIEYTAFAGPGGEPLHFYAVVDVVDELVITATFTSTEERYDELFPEVEPFLLTLRGT